MLEDHARLIALFKQAGGVTGRKKLQKIIYILKKLNYPFNEKYQFHFYGPYSEELSLRIEELCNLGFVSEVKEKKSGYYQYRYTLTGEGERFLEHYQLDMPLLDECVQRMNDESSRFLELVSTIAYFDHLERDEIKEKVAIVKKKQNYTDEEIERAHQYIADLEKLKVARI